MSKTRYYKCIKDFVMQDGDTQHREGIIYPMIDNNMPSGGEMTTHIFPESYIMSPEFKECFSEVYLADASVTAAANKFQDDFDALILECKDDPDSLEMIGKRLEAAMEKLKSKGL